VTKQRLAKNIFVVLNWLCLNLIYWWEVGKRKIKSTMKKLHYLIIHLFHQIL